MNDDSEDFLEEEFDASSYAPATTTFHEPRAEPFVAHVVPPPPPPADIDAPPPYNPQWNPSHPNKKTELGPNISPVINTPVAPNASSLNRNNINANPRPPRPMRPPPVSSTTPNHTFRPLSSSEQNGGGSDGDGTGRGNGKNDNNNDKDANMLPQAPTGKLLTPEERAKLEQEDQKRLEVQSIQKARQMQQEAARKSEERLYHLRLQHEDEQIALRRIEDYQRRRKRQQALAKECARRMTYPPATHESRMPPAEDEAIARELSGLQFKDGWRSVFAAFGVGGPEDFIKSVRADEEFNSYIESTSVRLVDAELVRDFMRMVLEGAPAGHHVRRVVVSPPEQYDPDPAQRVSLFSLGRCLRAVPVVFTSLLSHQWDLLSDARRGNLTEQDWLRLLNTAKAHVSSLLGLSLGALRMKYPLLMSPQSRIKQDPEIETRFFVRECLQQALVGLFDRGLGLFYYQVFVEKDKKLQEVARRFHGKGLVEVAVDLGLNPNSSVAKQLVVNPEMEVGIVHAVRNALVIVCAPSLRLSLFVDCSRALGSLGVSGDEFLPLFCAALVLGMDTAPKPAIKLASLANIMDDFALPEDFRHGESGYVCSTVLTAVEVLLEEADRAAPASSVDNKPEDEKFNEKKTMPLVNKQQVEQTSQQMKVESVASHVEDSLETEEAAQSSSLKANSGEEQANESIVRSSDAGASSLESNTVDEKETTQNIIHNGGAAVVDDSQSNEVILSTNLLLVGSTTSDNNVILNQKKSLESIKMINPDNNQTGGGGVVGSELLPESTITEGNEVSLVNNNQKYIDDVEFLVLNEEQIKHPPTLMSLENKFDKSGRQDVSGKITADGEEAIGRERLPSLDADVAKVKSILAQMNMDSNNEDSNIRQMCDDGKGDDGSCLMPVVDLDTPASFWKQEEETVMESSSQVCDQPEGTSSETNTSALKMRMLETGITSHMRSGLCVSKRRWEESEQTTEDDSQSFKFEAASTTNLDEHPLALDIEKQTQHPSAAVDVEEREQQQHHLLSVMEMERIPKEDEVTKDNCDQQSSAENEEAIINLDRSKALPTTVE